MSWLKKFFSPAPAPATAEAEHAGQQRMTLDERMAFRRKMTVEAVRTVMAGHGIPAAAYMLHVSQMDQRGHRYAVMLELRPLAGGRLVDSVGECQSLESDIIQTAAKRYRVGVDGVYWRMTALMSMGTKGPELTAHQRGAAESADSAGCADAVDSEWATLIASGASPASPTPLSPRGPQVLPAAAAASVGGHGTGLALPAAPLDLPPPPSPPAVTALPRAAATVHKVNKNADGFPDTLIEDRSSGYEGVGTDELLAFEEAIRQGHSPKQPVKLGSRSYQTDYMPLGD